MKKLVLISFLFYFFTNCISAQEPASGHTPEERAKLIDEWMKENLHATDDQMPQLEALNLEYAKKMESVKQISGKIDQLKTAREILQEKDEKLKKILTKDQFNLYQEKKKELRDQVRNAYQERKNQTNRTD